MIRPILFSIIKTTKFASGGLAKYWTLLQSYAARILTHWGRVTHICVSKLTIIGSDNGLSPGRRQAIFWTNAEILLIGSLGTNLSEILVGIQKLPFKKMHLKMSSAKWCPFSLGLNVLTLMDVMDKKIHSMSMLRRLRDGMANIFRQQLTLSFLCE